jgi:hypothetical protein
VSNITDRGTSGSTSRYHVFSCRYHIFSSTDEENTQAIVTETEIHPAKAVSAGATAVLPVGQPLLWGTCWGGRGLDESGLVGGGHRLGFLPDVELCHHPGKVCFHGGFADE